MFALTLRFLFCPVQANAKTKPNFSKVKTSVATAPNRKAAGKSGGSESRKIQASDIQLVSEGFPMVAGCNVVHVC